MSGIYGYVADKALDDLRALLGRMRQALPPRTASDEHKWISPTGRACLGSIHPSRIQEPWHFSASPLHQVFCVFDGIIYDQKRDNGNSIAPMGASVLLDRYLEVGTACLSQLSGSFVVAWWDEQNGRLTLASDKIGNRLLFFGHQAGQLAFSSLLVRVLATGLVSWGIDLRSLADLLNYGYTLGQKTLFEKVELLPPATIMTFEDGTIGRERYWSLDRIGCHGKYDRNRLDELVSVFNQAVRRSVRSDLTCAIGLTGGRDSRCVLASVAYQELNCLAHTGGQPDSTDVKLAAQASRVAGVPHIFRQLDPNRLAPLLESMVRYQGGIAATLHSHPCSLHNDPPPFDGQLEGIGGEFANGTWAKPHHLKVSEPEKIVDYLQSRVASSTARRMDIGQLFLPEYRSLYYECKSENMSLALAEHAPPEWSAGLCDLFHLYERIRKFHNRAPLMIRGVIESYHPFLDHEWMEALFSIPLPARMTSMIRIDLIRKLAPSLLKVPYEWTLLPLSASERRIKWTKQLWKLRRGLARVNKRFAPPSKVPVGYYWRWSRKQMKPYLVDLLFNPKANLRAYLRWDMLEPILDDHFAGREDWTQLVGALTVLELAHRL